MTKLLKKSLKKLLNWLKKYFAGGLWHKIVVILLFLIFILSIFMYSIAEWYIHSESKVPITYGVSFVPDYAESLGLNPQSTMQSLLNIGVRQFRLTSYWSDLAPTSKSYDFSLLDWQFKLAEQYGAKVTLTVGLRQPRWPECHIPSWAVNEPTATWEKQLYAFIKAIVNRYKNSPALQNYQLENEYFLRGFGTCTNFSRQRLVHEYNLVKSLDNRHPIIVGRSNNAIGIPLGNPKPDMYSISIYTRVWDANITHQYLTYPFPSWYYAFLAGIQKIILGKNMVIDEMQAEAWPPDGKSITQVNLAQQNKTMNASDLKYSFEFAKKTGMKSVDMWGAEYWYYRMIILHDPSLWNVAVKEFSKN